MTGAEYEGNISPAFRKRIEEITEDRELNKADLARGAGVSLPVITRAAVYGIIPRVKTLVKIADFLEVPIKYLLGETDESEFYRAEKPTTFWERTAALAAERGENFSRVASRMPFTKNFFYEWRRSKTYPSIEYLFALSEYFGVSPDYLLGRTDDRN